METQVITKSLLEDLCRGVCSRLINEKDPKKAADSFIELITEDLKELDEDRAITLSVQRTKAGGYVNERRYKDVRHDPEGTRLYCAVGSSHLNFQIALLE